MCVFLVFLLSGSDVLRLYMSLSYLLCMEIDDIDYLDSSETESEKEEIQTSK
jgi:hypothetical protein